MSVGARRVAITGVSTIWGAALATRLERSAETEHLVGIDSRPPPIELERAEYLDVDLRDPRISRLLPSTGVDTVVHCGILWYPEPGRPPRALHEINVIGTLQLLAACERTPTLERVIVRGSAAIYGCEPAGPSFFAEDDTGRRPLRTRFQRDISELESYFENFARRHPELSCCMLRFQPEIGPRLDTPLVRYLSLPVVPVQLGFDPRLQLLHSDDATGALAAAVRRPAPGAVNVAPSGSISLSRLLRVLGRPALPIPASLFEPLLSRLGGGLGAGGLLDDGVRMLRYGRGLDNRRLLDEIGYEPRFDATEAARDLATRSAAPIASGLRPDAIAGRVRGIFP